MKTCSRCQGEKSRHEFNRDSARNDGLQLWCKACQRSAKQEYYAANRDAVLASNQAWRDRNRARYNEYMREYRRQRS